MTLYGDLMTAIIDLLFLPMCIASCSKPIPLSSELKVLYLMLGCCSLHWIAWAKSHRGISIAAFFLKMVDLVVTVVSRWPYGNSVPLQQFLWMIFIHIGGNYEHRMPVKVAMLACACTCAIICALLTDGVDLVSTLVICFGATVLAIILHLYALQRYFRLKDELHNSQVAGLILFTVYSHHLVSEVLGIARVPGYGPTGGYNIVKMGVVASMGIIAGAYEDQVSTKQALQRLVRLKGDEMAQTAAEVNSSIASEASETGIAITDGQYTIIWSDHALEKLIGLTAETTPGCCLVDAMQLDVGSKSLFRSCFDTCEKGMELHMAQKDVRILVIPFSFPSFVDGTPETRYLVSLTDITLGRARERAKIAAEQSALRRTAMQESMEILIHELRTPLQGIIGTASLVFDSAHASSEEISECLNIVMASSRLLVTLINNLLDSHKMDADLLEEFQLLPISLVAAMKDAANFCRPLAGMCDTHLRLCLEFDESAMEDVLVQSNIVRFQQVLVNLVSNAIKYAGRGSIDLRAEVVSVEDAIGRIRNALAHPPQCSVASPTSKVAIISVEDSGQGIPADLVDRVFQRFAQYSHPDKLFTRSGSYSTCLSGTGIGLNLCLRFVERMGGNIWVANKASGGACFSFCLPVEQTLRIPHSKVSSKRTNAILGNMTDNLASAEPSAVQTLKILLVDDTVVNLKVLDRMIQRLSAGYNVTSADSGEAALEVLSHSQIDLVITDIQMPHMDGIELSKMIRDTDSVHPKPVIVALTAESSELLQNRCSNVGISHILFKPISAHQFKFFFESVMPALSPCDVAVLSSLERDAGESDDRSGRDSATLETALG